MSLQERLDASRDPYTFVTLTGVTVVLGGVYSLTTNGDIVWGAIGIVLGGAAAGVAETLGYRERRRHPRE